jgi:hypothetical protein
MGQRGPRRRRRDQRRGSRGRSRRNDGSLAMLGQAARANGPGPFALFVVLGVGEELFFRGYW